MRKMQKIRLAAVVVSVVLLLGGTLSGTLAWMLARTSAVTNTFSTSDITITLTETGMDEDTRIKEYKMIPGVVRGKDPTVTVTDTSEDCWVFIKINKSQNLDSYIAYTIDLTKWKALDGYDGVYYQSVSKTTEDRELEILGSGRGYFDPGRNSFTYPLSDEELEKLKLDKDYDADNLYVWDAENVLVKPTVKEEDMTALEGNDSPYLTFTAYAAQYYRSENVPFDPVDAWKILNPTT